MTPLRPVVLFRGTGAVTGLLLVAAAVLATPPASAPAPRPAPPSLSPAPHWAPSAVPLPVAETQDVVIFTTTRPVRVRLAIRNHGQSVADQWRDKLKAAYTFFDRDHDGVLTAAEVPHIFSDSGMVIMLQNGFYQPTPQDRPTLERLDTSGDGRVTLDEFIAYYKQSAAQLLRPQAALAENPYLASVTDGIFKMLDANGDGQLTQAEVAAAEKWLASRDADEDECLSQAELTNNPLATPAGGRVVLPTQPGRPGQPTSPSPQLVHIFESDRIPGTITQQIFKKYDTNADFELTPAEAGFDEQTFSRLDRDSNGRLDGEELDAWRTGPPDVEVTLSLAAKAVDCVAQVHTSPQELARRGLSVQQVENGRVMIRVGRQPIELWAYAGLLVSQQPLKQQYQYLFTQPAGQKGYIVEKDLTGPNAVQYQFLRTIFDAADANGNGQLTRAEFDAYFDLQDSFRTQALAVTPSVQTPTLFQLLDGNNDGRLSVRELRTAWDRLIKLEPSGATVITRAAIQPTLSVRLSRSLERFAAYQAQYATPNPNQVPVPQQGPLWFRKMDRNADGDVSRIEYLGTRAEFEAIDTDHDGLISLAEAEAWDQKVRGKNK